MRKQVNVMLWLTLTLSGGNWNCSNQNGLWDCRAPAPEVATASSAEPRRRGGVEKALATDGALQGDATGVAQSDVTGASQSDATGALQGDVAGAAVQTSELAGSASDPQPDSQLALYFAGESTQPSAPPDEDAWVVQLGAYGDEATARHARDELGRQGLIIMPTRRGGEDWYVLLLGAYETQAMADAAGAEFVAGGGGSYWVRSVKSLERILNTGPR